MTLAVMQPYFFPYIGYFQLIEASDRFVLADEVQYIRHGWINRNRLQNFKGEVCYITAPVKKHSLQAIIKYISVVDGDIWKKEIFKKIAIYKKKAPFYKDVYHLLEKCFSAEYSGIATLNRVCLTHTCDYLGINKKIEVQSDLKLDYSKVTNKTERVLQFCNQLKADTYINLPGGMALYNKNNFDDKGITLKFIKPNLRPYPQIASPFEPALSILDVMMFNSPQEIKEMLQDYKLL